MGDTTKRFLRYITIDTASDPESGMHPSSEKQKDLGRLLAGELRELGAEEVFFDERYGYVYAKIPASDGGRQTKTLGFLSHMDTSPEARGDHVQAQIIENYDGGEIPLPAGEGKVLSPKVFPEMRRYIGKTLITSDGSTLLGADDKAGIAEIMTMASILLKDLKEGTGAYRHGPLSICFTPDEEIGEGTAKIDLARFGADHAYTVDGGALGELEYETFNAASARVTIEGVPVHPGEAKGKMVNAAALTAAFHRELPADMVPEKTGGYEGFIHLVGLSGTVSEARMDYIIRDHDRKKFAGKKEIMTQAAARVNERLGGEYIFLTITDSYYNMREKIEPDAMFLVDLARDAMKAQGIEPIVQPVRGGTDGSALSFMGVPCPNLCAGGHNFHGIYEYCCAESLEAITGLLLGIACGYGDLPL